MKFKNKTQEYIDLWQFKEYTSMRPGLSRIKRFLYKVGNPQNRFKSILISGTNGKGSTAHMLSEIISGAGYKTGLYTSPHLVDIEERIQINSRKIMKAKFIEYSRKYLPLAKKYSLTFYEFITAIAFIHFSKEKVDIAVLEIGLGGRFDAANVVKRPLLSIVTSIGYDHCEVLGKTIKDIAFEKAGIIKKGCPVISGAEHLVSRHLIEDISKKRKSQLFLANKDFSCKSISTNWRNGQQKIFYNGLKNKLTIVLSLLGKHQAKNCSLALAACELLNKSKFIIDRKAMLNSLSKVRILGRFNVLEKSIRGKLKTIILDGAHNINAIDNFTSNLSVSPWGGKKRTFIFSILKDKNYRSIIRKLHPFVKKVILAPVDSERRLSSEELFKLWEKYLRKDKIIKSESIYEAFKKAKNSKIIVVTGSLYLIGNVLKKMRWQ
ncbi:MAG: bifunctional folylpolyglutamate synthase/dihydrofolate synthase [Endomicrobiales bacterium]|nr:bifunctional folylpolyglutamate synthase/dihydrofolate synthase [Endomicrobiales bacterium]